ncbi:hypothetical protein ABW636_20350 [Aquimarina sp. 2201CG1-2-11]|uniref:hypothetical protein n=1 Tax=Aquimarina discodermiae TaxID=3231043 RepID=UPI003462F6C9
MSSAIVSCSSEKPKVNAENSKIAEIEKKSDTTTKHIKPFNIDLPTIGLLMYDGVLQGEVVATSDVFAKPTKEGKYIFNVITIAETEDPITTEEGLRLIPDYTFDNCPKLNALFIPSAYDMSTQVQNTSNLSSILKIGKFG